MQESLWGEEFNPIAVDIKPKKVKSSRSSAKVSTPKTKKAVSKITKEEQLSSIKVEVLRILGVYKDNTVVIKSVEELHNYITESIANKIISIDTETNNSLDPVNCKIMGLCLYTPQ